MTSSLKCIKALVIAYWPVMRHIGTSTELFRATIKYHFFTRYRQPPRINYSAVKIAECLTIRDGARSRPATNIIGINRHGRSSRKISISMREGNVNVRHNRTRCSVFVTNGYHYLLLTLASNISRLKRREKKRKRSME